MSRYDLPQEILQGVFWVGNRQTDDFLRCNPYLLDLGEEYALIDPGGWEDFAPVMEKILCVTDLSRLKYIVLQHQDPDICAMVPLIEDMVETPLTILTHPYNLPFLKHYGIRSSSQSILENGGKFSPEKSSLVLEFLSTPYLHSPGSFMTLMSQHKVLFSSDLFGWVGLEDWDLFDTRLERQGYADWHLQIVPHKKILKPILEKVRDLDLEMIAPQHGSVLKGKDTLNRIYAKLEKINYSLKEILGE